MFDFKIRAGNRISARGGRDFLGTRLFQELGTNKEKGSKLKKKGTKLKKKGIELNEKEQTQEKGTTLKKKVHHSQSSSLRAQSPPCPPLVAALGIIMFSRR